MGNCQANMRPSQQIGNYEFMPNHLIGTSDLGTTYKGHHMTDIDHPLVIKCLNRRYTEHDINAIKPGLYKLTSIEHENLLNYRDCYYDERESKLYLISKYCSYGNLNDFIMSDLKMDPLEDLREALVYCQQLINGLMTLHKNNIIHGRLKPKNVLVDCRKLKISDFGLYTTLGISGDVFRPSSIYDAPELFQNSICESTMKGDIWSLGVIMYQLVYKANPVKIIEGEYIYEELESGKCEIFDELIKRCLKANPEERISSAELREHTFVSFSPRKIEYLPKQWAATRSSNYSSPQSAHRLFYREVGFATRA